MEALGESDLEGLAEGDSEALGEADLEGDDDGESEAEDKTTAATWAPNEVRAIAIQPAVLLILTTDQTWPALSVNTSPAPLESTLLIFSVEAERKSHCTEGKIVILCPTGTSANAGSKM